MRTALAGLVPPAIMQPARRMWRRMNGLGWHNLSGSWPTIAEVPVTAADGDAWARSIGPDWFDRLTASARAPSIDTGQYILPLLAAQYAGPLTVCDFGGGAGVGLAQIINYGRFDPSRLHYVLVETPAMCRAIRAALERRSGRAVEEIPASLPQPLIVNASSSLQYMVDYAATLERLVRLAPRQLIVSQTPFSDAPTFACQILNTPHRVLATWVFNRGEIVERLRALGYELVFTAEHDVPLTHGKAPARTEIVSMVFVPARADSEAASQPVRCT